LPGESGAGEPHRRRLHAWSPTTTEPRLPNQPDTPPRRRGASSMPPTASPPPLLAEQEAPGPCSERRTFAPVALLPYEEPQAGAHADPRRCPRRACLSLRCGPSLTGGGAGPACADDCGSPCRLRAVRRDRGVAR